MLVIKVPFGAGNLKKKNGLEKSPDAVEHAAKNFYMNESGFLPVLEFEEVKVDNSNIDESHKIIQERISKVNQFSVMLGGDHSVTLPAFKGFAKGKQNPGLLVFDAHPDLMQAFGTHEDYLRTLIEENALKPQNIVLVGLRNCDKEEISFMKEKKIKNFTMKEISMEGITDVCDAAMSATRNWSDLYVSLDIDVLDPAFAPGTGHCEPGGLSTRELLYFVHRLKNLRNFRMADIVEVNPDIDLNNITVQAAAKLLVELS